MGHYQRLGVVGVEDVINAILKRQNTPGSPKVVQVLGAEVKVSGLRLRTFAKNELCCSNPECSVKPSFFAIERNLGDPDDSPTKRPYHLNLYGKNARGDEVLFTHDHTLARGLGGEDNIENTTTMCLPCNQKKSRWEGALANRRRRMAENPDAPEYAPPSDRKIERQRTMFEAERSLVNMDVDTFIAHCNAKGGEFHQVAENAQSMRDPRARIASVLGLRLEGYMFLRHIHNERMRAEIAGNTPRAARPV